MSNKHQDFEQALDQLILMYRSLASIHEDVSPRNADNFGLLAEGCLKHIRQLEATVAELGGRRAAEAYELRRWGGPPPKHAHSVPTQ